MSGHKRHLEPRHPSQGGVEWTVEIETPGSYQFGLVCDDDGTASSCLHCPVDLFIDNRLAFTFRHQCNKTFAHLTSGNHAVRLSTEGKVSPITTKIHWIDIRLAYPNCGRYPQTVLLKAGQSIDKDHSFDPSPSKRYSVEFQCQTGDLILYDGGGSSSKKQVVWRADWNKRSSPPDSKSETAFFKLAMQGDGNLLLQRYHREQKDSELVSKVVWKTLTQANPGAYLVLNDAGQLLVIDPHRTETSCCSPLYIDGLVPSSEHYEAMRRRCQNDDDHFYLLLPRDKQRRLPPQQPQLPPTTPSFPIRGIFYYPWYPTTWTVDNKKHVAHFIPKLGRYDSGHLAVILNHVQQLEFGNIDVAISSWWGLDTKSDRARLLTIMDVSYYLTGGSLKWCIYFEPQKHDDTVPGLKEKLQYLNKWFTHHPSWLHIDGKPVMFVYNLKSDCSTSQKWVQACRDANFYVVLKWFGGWKDCRYQPQSWHQYGPSKPWHHGQREFVNISPGFWQARESTPRLERLSEDAWKASVRKMVSVRDVKWHLVTSFNEACEGTLIEATKEWDTTENGSGMGYFLEALHEIK